MGTIFVALLVHGHILPEWLFALLTHESHLQCPRESVSLPLIMTFRTVKPLLATGRTDRDLRV